MTTQRWHGIGISCLPLGPDTVDVLIAKRPTPTNRHLSLLWPLATAALVVGLASPASASHAFAAESGFDKARFGRSSILMCDDSGQIDLSQVIAPWNRTAGWELFAVSCAAPDVVFRSGVTTWVQADYLGPFLGCTIHVADYGVETLRHELGHCLGFADHVYRGQDRTVWVNAAVCDDPSHPAYMPYRGVMSYCDSSLTQLWFGTDDQLMLARARYADRPRQDTSEVRVAGMKVVASAETDQQKGVGADERVSDERSALRDSDTDQEDPQNSAEAPVARPNDDATKRSPDNTDRSFRLLDLLAAMLVVLASPLVLLRRIRLGKNA